MNQEKNKVEFARPLAGVIFFTCLYLLFTTIVCIKRQNHEFFFYVCNVLVFIAVVIRVHIKCHLSNVLLWALSIWGLLHMAGGIVFVPEEWVSANKSTVLYNVWIIRGFFKFDHFVHDHRFVLG